MKPDTAMYLWWVPGVAKAQGSMTPMTNPRTGKTFVKQPKSMLEWRKWVMAIARDNRPPQPLAGAKVSLSFWLPRPKSHPKYTHASPWVHKKPDIDKLARAVLDALTYANVLQDDAVVAELTVTKQYDDYNDGRPGVEIRVFPLDSPTNPRNT